MKIDTAYSFGFSRPSRAMPFGTSQSAFGCPGAGGSFAMADPDEQLGFAYVTNQMGYYLFDDPREKALRDACYRCLATMQQGMLACRYRANAGWSPSLADRVAEEGWLV